LLFGKGKIVLPQRDPQHFEEICVECFAEDAIVFCHRHKRYVGASCLPLHSIPAFCKFSSMAVVRELATDAVIQGRSQWP
jgi:hypothetical protein